MTNIQVKQNLEAKLALFQDHWAPRTIAVFNDYDAMVSKLLGRFHWHVHEDTDELFLVVSGQLEIELRDRTVTLEPGELFVVPRGVEHRPFAKLEVHVLLIEPSGTPNTGDRSTSALRRLCLD